MKIAYDIYSETNPAFCTCALLSFAKAYATVKSDGAELVTFYLFLPIALSGDLASSFDRTNKRTGLREWLERTPLVRIGLGNRINGSLDIVTDGLRFALYSGVLRFSDDSRLLPGARKVKARAIASLGKGSAHTIKHAERLGYWCAGAGSTSTVLDIMGVTV